MSGPVTDFRDEPLTPDELAMLDRARHAVLPGVAEVIDLPVLRPEHERIARFVGKLLGAGWFWAEEGVIWSWRWAARRVRP